MPGISNVTTGSDHPVDLRFKSLAWFLCSGNTNLNC